MTFLAGTAGHRWRESHWHIPQSSILIREFFHFHSHVKHVLRQFEYGLIKTFGSRHRLYRQLTPSARRVETGNYTVPLQSLSGILTRLFNHQGLFLISGTLVQTLSFKCRIQTSEKTPELFLLLYHVSVLLECRHDEPTYVRGEHLQAFPSCSGLRRQVGPEVL